MLVKVKINGSKIEVVSNYNKDFVREAKKLGGKWNGKAWVFDIDDETAVREVLKNVYGTDGEGEVELVTVRVPLDCTGTENDKELVMFGESLAYRPFRDSDVKLNDNVRIISGGFCSSGGSRSYPSLNYIEGTVITVKNVPIILAEKAIKTYGDDITIVKKNELNKDNLIKEKEMLLTRLEEINKLLEE